MKNITINIISKFNIQKKLKYLNSKIIIIKFKIINKLFIKLEKVNKNI